MRIAALLAAAGLAVALWWRRHPSACPYAQRFWVEAPHPLITRERLRRTLEPRPGERILEVGPGTGYYSLPVAEWLGPDGRLELFDVQQEMLDHTLRRAGPLAARMHPTRGDARSLPYPDATFDAAYLVTVLGEIPEPQAVLRELRRVLRPGGRVVVGEVAVDPHVVFPGALERHAAAAGLRLERRDGSAVGYFARLVPVQGKESTLQPASEA
ncbi:MAG TPA: methyltransferase domain-containing protein [Solirubrobacteraceae bacterium]